MERNYDFRKRLLQVHRAHWRDLSITPAPGELALGQSVDLYLSQSAGRVLLRAALDMQEYLRVSMGIAARILPVADVRATLAQGRGIIAFTTCEQPNELPPQAAMPRGYRVDVDHNILITGYDEAGAMQGGFYLEDVMNLRRAPLLPQGSVARGPLFSPRMVHSGYGLDDYPDEHIAAIAHAGMDALLVFVQAPDTTPYGYLDFNSLCWRAAEYGVDVYAYSYLKSELHPDDPGADEYYQRVYGSVFEHCPAFKGIVLVGESVEFPSKDERTTGKPYTTPSPDGLPADKPSPGWWPCRDYPQWLAQIKAAVRTHKSDADIVFWTYNWGYVDEPYRIELIDSLPTDISLLVTFEMFENIPTGSVTSTCVDYTLMFEGPGAYFLSEAQAAKRRGIRLYAMANTGGLTWDIGVIPYEPAPYQWMRRHSALLEAREQYGLCGLMESHHFGFWPSFISDLAKWTFTAGAPQAHDTLRALAQRDFGADNADTVLAAWRLWSEGIRHYVSTNEDQYGPFRIGPAYPLVLSRPVSVPESPHAMFGSRICNTLYAAQDTGRCSLLSFRLPVEIERLSHMRDAFAQGADMLQGLLDTLPEPLHDQGQRMANLGRFIALCAQTTIHVKQWYQLKLRLLGAQDGHTLTQTVQAMHAIVDAEQANAEAAIPLVQYDSRLGWEPSMEYMCDESHLRWKLRQLTLVRRELDMYVQALRHNR